MLSQILELEWTLEIIGPKFFFLKMRNLRLRMEKKPPNLSICTRVSSAAQLFGAHHWEPLTLQCSRGERTNPLILQSLTGGFKN